MNRQIINILLFLFSINGYCQIIQYEGNNSKETIEFIKIHVNAYGKKAIKDTLNYYPGFILKNGEKRYCEIFSKIPYQYDNAFVFIIARFMDDSTKIYTANEIDGYKINDAFFISYKSLNTNHFFRLIQNGRIFLLEKGATPDDYDYKYFLKLQEQDFFSVIVPYTKHQSSNYNDVSELFQFENKEFKLTKIIENKIEDFFLNLPDLCEILKTKIRSGFYTKNDINSIVQEYNTCNQQNEQIKIKTYFISEQSKSDSIKIHLKHLPLPPEEPVSPDTVFKYVKGMFSLIGGIGGGMPIIYKGNFAKANMEYGDSIDFFSPKPTVHFVLSPRFSFLLTKRIRLQTGFDFSVFVEDMNVTRRRSAHSDSISVNFNSIGVPICFIIRILNKPTSPTISLGITPRILELGWKSDLDLKKFDASIDIGIGLDRMTTYRWSLIELKYSFGLTNLNQSNSKIIYNSLIEKMYYSTLTLFLNIW